MGQVQESRSEICAFKGPVFVFGFFLSIMFNVQLYFKPETILSEIGFLKYLSQE